MAFVVVPIEQVVKRQVCRFDKKGGKGIIHREEDQPGGFMVYFPRGHALRLRSRAELAHYGLDQEPNIINMSGLADRNSPLGRLLSSQDEQARKCAMHDLERAVIQLATAKTGPVLMPEQVR